MPLEDALPDYLKSTFDASVNGALPLVGFVSRGGRQGDWHLYTGLDMARRLEIAESDILGFERLSSDESPFGRLGGTRLLVRKDADIRTHRMFAREETAGDEFDLDIRVGGLLAATKEDCEGTGGGTTCAAECAGNTDIPCTDNCTIGCPPPTRHTCATDCGPTCRDTCATCNQKTCNTCDTNCNQNTCHTCQTKCQQATCGTCNQGTCHTCNQATCHTCRPLCDTSPGDTCAACTHVTCGHQPGCNPV
jgi:hypothetical protein